MVQQQKSSSGCKATTSDGSDTTLARRRLIGWARQPELIFAKSCLLEMKEVSRNARWVGGLGSFVFSLDLCRT